MKFEVALLSLCLALPITGVRADDPIPPAKNAREFLDRVALVKRGGGAGNGGNSLLSQYFESALSGVTKLELLLTKTDRAGDADRIRKAMPLVSVYPVDFSLCPDDARSDCAEDAAYASKNYPESKTILVDARDRPGKWRRMGAGERMRHATHEFAGIAGIEVENHFFTAQIDEPDVYDRFESRSDRKRYFKLLNDLFSLLPGSAAEEFHALWLKKTSLRLGRYTYSQDRSEFIRGDKFALAVRTRPGTGYNVPGKNEGLDDLFGGSVVNIDDYSALFRLGGSTFQGESVSIMLGDCTPAIYRDGVIACGVNEQGFPGLIDFKGKVRQLYEPSFPTVLPKKIPMFTCKKLEDARMICRNIHYGNFFAGYYRWYYEYLFFDAADGSENLPPAVRTRTKDFFEETARTSP